MSNAKSAANRLRPSLLSACSFAVFMAGFGISAGAAPAEPAPTEGAAAPAKPKLDRSGRKRVGEASFYADKFFGKKMASGKNMNPRGNNAASKTLPLGTKAKVTNLETGESAVVNIEDRGPYIKGRIVDLSPSTARQIGITEEQGVAPVEVAPLVVPQADGSVKPGDALKEEIDAADGGNSRRAGALPNGGPAP